MENRLLKIGIPVARFSSRHDRIVVDCMQDTVPLGPWGSFTPGGMRGRAESQASRLRSAAPATMAQMKGEYHPV